jgi:predicted DNA-binding transcriptional regulator AlpA
MKHEILLLPEVAERLRVSTATVNRLLAQRREGTGAFPLPLSSYKGKGRWLASQLDDYIASLSNVNDGTTVPAKSKKKQEREYSERQRKAKAALARHSTNKKGA